jgi:CubicO group peptidase (beta-lactamase class C family)
MDALRLEVRFALRSLHGVLSLIATLGTGALSLPAQSVDTFAQVRSAMQRMLDSAGAPSVSVAVGKGGQIVFEEAIGWADREKHVAATPNTIYALASITKPMTATGVMVLVERGKIDLDKPVNTYLGSAKITGLAGSADEATVRRVLSHTAGLPQHSSFFYVDQPYTTPSLSETITRYGNVVFPPGRVEEYSNLGYAILGEVIEHVSGEPYAQFMQREVFDPLGLSHTSIGAPADSTGVAVKYGTSGRPLPSFILDVPGAGWGHSSAHDLVRFAMFHLGHQPPHRRAVLTASTIDEMHRPVAPGTNALGFGVYDNGKRLAHTGGMPGATTLMVLFPERDVAVVVLSNTTTRPSAMLHEFTIARLAMAAVSGESVQLGPQIGAGAPVSLSAVPTELAGEWIGTVRTYQSTLPMRLNVATDGTIDVSIADQPAVRVANATFEHGRLSGDVATTIPTEDASRWPHRLSLGLLLYDGKLAGEVTANSTADRTYFTLTSYAELRKR